MAERVILSQEHKSELTSEGPPSISTFIYANSDESEYRRDSQKHLTQPIPHPGTLNAQTPSSNHFPLTAVLFFIFVVFAFLVNNYEFLLISLTACVFFSIPSQWRIFAISNGFESKSNLFFEYLTGQRDMIHDLLAFMVTRRRRKNFKNTIEKEHIELKGSLLPLSLRRLTDYDEIEKKHQGTLDGFKAQHTTTLDNYMIKQGFRSDIKKLSGKNCYQTISCIHEWMTSGLYKRLLFNRTASITLMLGEEKKDPRFFIGSKEIKGFQSLESIKKKEVPLKINGLEKVHAVMGFCGEYDNNFTNLGIVMDGDHAILSKVDHGWSCTKYFTSTENLMQSIAASLKAHSHDGPFAVHFSEFDYTKFCEAIDSITQLTDEEITRFIQHKIHLLKKTQLDLSELSIYLWVDDVVHDYEKKAPTEYSVRTYDELELFYLHFFKSHLRLFKQLSNELQSLKNINQLSKDWFFAIANHHNGSIKDYVAATTQASSPAQEKVGPSSKL